MRESEGDFDLAEGDGQVRNPGLTPLPQINLMHLLSDILDFASLCFNVCTASRDGSCRVHSLSQIHPSNQNQIGGNGAHMGPK